MKEFIHQNINFFWLWFGFLVLLGGFSAGVNLNTEQPYLFSDEAVYCAMGYSLAWDYDIQYTRQDLERFFTFWPHGPKGIFLKKTLMPGSPLAFGKAYIYPLLSAPFVRLWGSNGFLLLNTLLFCGSVLIAYIFLRRYCSELEAGILVIIYFFLSGVFIYLFWITPEMLNHFCITLILFLSFPVPDESANGKRIRLLLASIALGIATYSKITNILFIIPVLAMELFEWKDERGLRFKTERIIPAFMPVMVCLIAVALLFSVQKLWTGDYNYQGGNRKTFVHQFPYQDEDSTFENTGYTMTTGAGSYKPNIQMNWILHNVVYLLTGRFAGMFPYYIPGLLLIFFFFTGKKTVAQVSVFLAAMLYCLVLIVMIPHNFLGGGGAYGNRYFMNIYPAFLFLYSGPRFIKKIWFSAAAVSSLFLAGSLIQPLHTSFHPGDHAKHLPFRFLPPELTCVYNVPSNVNPHYFNIKFHKTPGYSVFFLDDSTSGDTTIHEGGFWVWGKVTADLVLKPFIHIGAVDVTVQNGWVRNKVTVKCSTGKRKQIMEPGQKETFRFLTEGDLDFYKVSLVKLRVTSANGFVPRTMDDKSTDDRFLGCFVQIDIVPREWIEGIQLKSEHKWIDALARFKSMELVQYGVPAVYEEMALCYHNLDQPEEAERYKRKFDAYRNENPENITLSDHTD